MKYFSNETASKKAMGRTNQTHSAALSNATCFMGLTPVIQRRWIDNQTNLLLWDEVVSGLSWFYDQESHLMSYKIVSRSKRTEPYLSHENEKKSYEQWLALGIFVPLEGADPSIIDGREVESESEDDPEEIEGVQTFARDMTEDGPPAPTVDAEFDGFQRGKQKLYEDKTACMVVRDQEYCKAHGKTMKDHSSEERQAHLDERTRQWIIKNIEKKVQKMIAMQEAITTASYEASIKQGGHVVTDNPEDETGEEPEMAVTLDEIAEVRKFKFRISNDDPSFKALVIKSIQDLNDRYAPLGYRITVVFGKSIVCKCKKCNQMGQNLTHRTPKGSH